MPDFTMCSEMNCPKKEQCRRSPASGTQPNSVGYQSWAHFSAMLCNETNSDGGAFWPLFGTQGEIPRAFTVRHTFTDVGPKQ